MPFVFRPTSSSTAVLLTFGSALVVATCNTGRDRAAPPVVPTVVQATEPVASSAPPMPTELPAAPEPAPSASADAAPALPRTPGHELDNFYAALRALEHGAKTHVHVAWLGDSHGAADLWSGPLRAALQAKFGDGGPGFVHVGYKAYRHEGIHIEVKGRWAVHPHAPSTPVRTGDGVFGLGGVLFAGSADEPHTTLTVTDTALPPGLNWDLCYKLASEHDELEVRLSGEANHVFKPGPEEPLNTLRHVALRSAGPSPELKVAPLGGQPLLCGVRIETDPATQPGVVLDTLGINGARLITPLAWDEDAWVKELARRPPALVVVEYGTNESGDHTIHREVFAQNLEKLLARVRRAAPSSDCLVLAPTDRADTEETTPLVRDALRDAARASECRFWDTYTVMGGKGSIAAWRAQSPPRAAKDGVHLTPRGYKELGDKLAADVLAGYKP
jgi:lysophospholipase L1-like esterase